MARFTKPAQVPTVSRSPYAKKPTPPAGFDKRTDPFAIAQTMGGVGAVQGGMGALQAYAAELDALRGVDTEAERKRVRKANIYENDPLVDSNMPLGNDGDKVRWLRDHAPDIGELGSAFLNAYPLQKNPKYWLAMKNLEKFSRSFAKPKYGAKQNIVSEMLSPYENIARGKADFGDVGEVLFNTVSAAPKASLKALKAFLSKGNKAVVDSGMVNRGLNALKGDRIITHGTPTKGLTNLIPQSPRDQAVEGASVFGWNTSTKGDYTSALENPKMYAGGSGEVLVGKARKATTKLQHPELESVLRSSEAVRVLDRVPIGPNYEERMIAALRKAGVKAQPNPAERALIKAKKAVASKKMERQNKRSPV